jgi:hypothetical protein
MLVHWVGKRSEGKSFVLQLDRRYGDFGSNRVFEVESSNFVKIM